ncbi:hypothetical protein PFISCL1PPCAC_1024, partial [Pristionchus fissidentatus]
LLPVTINGGRFELIEHISACHPAEFAEFQREYRERFRYHSVKNLATDKELVVLALSAISSHTYFFGDQRCTTREITLLPLRSASRTLVTHNS